MMVVSILYNKLKNVVLLLLSVFRRALCVFGRRRRHSDSVPLTHVGVDAHGAPPEESWGWDDQLENAEPKTIQDHIELYRKRKNDVADVEENKDFFEDMTPRITRQTKVLIGAEETGRAANSRLIVSSVSAEGGELREWEDEGVGWEGETLDWDAQEALREKRRQDRERKLWEQQQKRLDKSSRVLGARLT